MKRQSQETVELCKKAKEVEEIFGLEGRVLKVLLAHFDEEFNVKDFSKHSSVSITFLNRYLPTLRKHQIVIQTRKIGKSTMFKINSNNRLVEALRKWFLEQQLRREIEEAKRTYEKEFSGEDIPEDLALLDLLAYINSAIPEEIEKKLEKKGFILTKDGKRYFTNRGYEIATALKEFNETVLERGS